MGDLVGIIPAAGQAVRWGGYPKEMLPTGKGQWILDHTVRSLLRARVTELIIVTTPTRIDVIVDHMSGYSEVPIAYVIEQKYTPDMWSAVAECLPFCGDHNLLAMPDTYYPETAFSGRKQYGDLHLGLFETDNPERFGVLINGCIYDKVAALAGTRQKAWGLVGWSRRVADIWLRELRTLGRFADALNLAIRQVGYVYFPVEYYTDFATWEDYQRWVASLGVEYEGLR